MQGVEVVQVPSRCRGAEELLNYSEADVHRLVAQTDAEVCRGAHVHIWSF